MIKDDHIIYYIKTTKSNYIKNIFRSFCLSLLGILILILKFGFDFIFVYNIILIGVFGLIFSTSYRTIEYILTKKSVSINGIYIAGYETTGKEAKLNFNANFSFLVGYFIIIFVIVIFL